MCTGFEMISMTGGQTLQLGGQLAGGIARMAEGDAQASLYEADAMRERDAATEQAAKIQRAARRQKGAARAATAASGARIDEFSVGVEDEIEQLGAQDAAMTILGGNRRGSTLEMAGKMQRNSARGDASASLFTSGAQAYTNWKGAKSAIDSQYFTGTRGMGD